MKIFCPVQPNFKHDQLKCIKNIELINLNQITYIELKENLKNVYNLVDKFIIKISFNNDTVELVYDSESTRRQDFNRLYYQLMRNQ